MATSPTISAYQRFNPVQLAGPIFDKEFRVASRQRRLYGLRFGYICLFILVIFQAHGGVSHSAGSTSSVTQVSQMSEVTKGIVALIAGYQFIAGQLLAAILLGGSISGEIRQRTLDVLLTTPVTSFQIVVGKLTSKLLQLLTFLAISLPILAVVRVFGGVPWDFVVASLCITLTASIFVGALALLLSVTSHRTNQVVGNVVGWCVVFWIGTTGALVLLEYYNYMSRAMSHFIGQLVNPFVMMIRMTKAMIEGQIAPSWGWHCLVTLSGAIVLLCLAIWRVRKIRRDSIPFSSERGAGRPGVSVGAKSGMAKARKVLPRGIRTVKGRPIVWKEMRKGFLIKRRRTVWDIICLIVAVAIILSSIVIMIAIGSIPPAVVFAGLAYAGLLMFTLGVTSASASAITQEKEASTWPILLATPLGNGEIVWGKALGSIGRYLPLIGISVALGLLALLLGANSSKLQGDHVLLFLGGVIRSIGTIVFLVGLALCIGIRVKTTAVAVVATFAVYLLARLAWAMVTIPIVVLVGPGYRVSNVIWMLIQAGVFALMGIIALKIATTRLRRNIFS